MSTDRPGAVPASRLAGFAAIGLAELNGQAALLKRLERKYVLDPAALDGLFDVLRFSHSVLEIDGLRSHGYQSRYYDTPDLLCFRAHNQGRANRFKLRIRRYEDSGLAFCELKEKTRVAATAKSRVPLSDPSALGDDFGGLLDRIRQIAGAAADRRFLPTLDVRYRRITLFDARDQTRVTIDTGLSFEHPTDLRAHQATSSVIVEVKSARPMSLTDRLLRDAGLRPQAQMSKYCIGLLACGLWTGASRFGANHRRLGCQPVAAAALAAAPAGVPA
ncbi:polyphosphate polymerase domain-containing protein [Hydrogenophaga flava]|uniref:polyphosphate polymerase domain-containing protein n=1 Tax=Hydrogenophaga flava TaxID=65657 RepID=UPI0008262E89|nr:polyphosphate polymerase domain-containing protein [Hydrogenophaga flava]